MTKIIDFASYKPMTTTQIESSISISGKHTPFVSANYCEHRSAWLIYIESPSYEGVDALYKQGLNLIHYQISSMM